MGCANSTAQVQRPVQLQQVPREDPKRQVQILTSMVILFSKSKAEAPAQASIRASLDQNQSPKLRDSSNFNQDTFVVRGPDKLTKTTSLTPLKIQSGLSTSRGYLPAKVPSFQEFGHDERQPKTPLRDDIKTTEWRKPSPESPLVANLRFGGRKSIVFKEPITPNVQTSSYNLKKSKTSRKSQHENLPLADYQSYSGVKIIDLPKRRMTAIGGQQLAQYPVQLGGSGRLPDLAKSGLTSKQTDLSAAPRTSGEQQPTSILKGGSSSRRRLNSEILDCQLPRSHQKLQLGQSQPIEIQDPKSATIKPFHARAQSNQTGSQIWIRRTNRSETNSQLDKMENILMSPNSPAEILSKSIQIVESKQIVAKPGQNKFDQLILEDPSKSEDGSISISKDLIEDDSKKMERSGSKQVDKLNEDSYHSVKIEGFQENKGNPFTKPKVNREIKVTKLRKSNSKNDALHV